MTPSVLASRSLAATFDIGINTIRFALDGGIIRPLNFSMFELCCVSSRHSTPSCPCTVIILFSLFYGIYASLTMVPRLAGAMGHSLI